MSWRTAALKTISTFIAADEDEIQNAAEHFRDMSANVEAVKADLARIEGVETLANVEAVKADLATIEGVETLYAQRRAGRSMPYLPTRASVSDKAF